MGTFDQRLLALAGRQHFVVGRAQLLEIGTSKQIHHRLQRGVLERLYRSVYRVSGSPDSMQQRVMAATFAGGKLSVGSFRTAAMLDGLPGGDEVIEITSQRWRRARHDGVIPHESNYLTDLDVKYIDNIPVTRTARTINDLGLLVAVGQLTPETLDQAMHEAVRRNLVDVQRVWREWERLGGVWRPGGAAVEQMLKRFTPPLRTVDSTGESRLLQLIRASGLPEPIPQYRVWISETKWFDLDFAYPPPRVFAEFDPYKWHGSREKYMRDAERNLLLRQLGWEGVSVTDEQLDAGAPLALDVLRELLRHRAA